MSYQEGIQFFWFENEISPCLVSDDLFNVISCQKQLENEIDVCAKEGEKSIPSTSNQQDQASNPQFESKSDQESMKEKGRKNQTKNIPKNFGRAIITFVEKERELVEPFLIAQGIEYAKVMAELTVVRKKINTIMGLRQLWTNTEYGMAMRAISEFFFKKKSLYYIFSSRISQTDSHIKYRNSMRQFLRSPWEFTNIKQK